jgi:glycine/D-amino acid oxidase-like deaminating enzyme
VEGTRIAGAASGKAGGFLASWAYPSCIVPLSFSLHEQLAREHGGEHRWGYRRVRCGQLVATGRETAAGKEGEARLGGDRDKSWISLGKRDTAPRRLREDIATILPEDVDWLLSETVDTFENISDVDCTAQVQPYLFTNCIAKLAEERGVRVVLGTVEDINYKEDASMLDEMGSSRRPLPPGKSFSGRVVTSVSYKDNATSVHCTIPASTIVLAAGPWTPNLFPWAPISSLRAHSVTIKLRKPLSNYCVFTEISIRNGNANETTSQDSSSSSSVASSAHTRTICPEILTRPNNEVYVCGHGDYNTPLPPAADEVEVSAQHCQELIDAAASISDDLRDGTVTSKRACYLPTVLPGLPGGPLLGPSGVEGLLLAAGHSCWGIQNAPATGLLLSEIIFDGEAKSADISSLDPRGIM